jgi:Protein of unknown function (DUF938)
MLDLLDRHGALARSKGARVAMRSQVLVPVASIRQNNRMQLAFFFRELFRFWPVQHADALVCINMIHITPWEACKGLMTGAERTLRSGGVLYLYGPYQIDGRHTAQSNEEFDAWLRTQSAQWGVRDLAEVTALAQRHAFSLRETVPMPANNLSVIFERGP